ncbi:MAG: HD domain-containing protein [Deltaproteobacteria bacterium]|nr:HD domain-containing protein [Deltaproteobacteria bacterium]
MTISSIRVADIQENQTVDLLLLVNRKNLAKSRNGKDYLNLKLGDSSGELAAFLWDDAERAGAAVNEGDCVHIKGRAQVFNGNLQLTLNFIELWLGPIDARQFLPHTDKHIPTLERDLRQIINDIQDPWLRRLCQAFFIKDQEFAKAFALAPAAKAMHHAWLGGLLEHTLGVAQLALKVTPLYPWINLDLVLAGALLHDIGKVHELTYERNLDYSTAGRLLGHVMLGVRMIQDKAATLKGFPAATLMLLEHLILSHHGEYEYGSPKRPKTQEAILLNFIDDLDAKITAVNSHMKAAKNTEAEWSDFHRLFGRAFYLGSQERLLESGSEEVPSPELPSAEPSLLF